MAWNDLVPWSQGRTERPARRGRTDDTPFLSLQRRMNDLFDAFSGDFDRSFGLERFGSFAMSSNFDEDEKEYRLRVELPGMSEKDLELRLSGDQLVLRAKKESSEDDEQTSSWSRSYRSFHQTLPVPEGVDRDKIAADLKNGVLLVHLPKTEEARRAWKQIEINASS